MQRVNNDHAVEITATLKNNVRVTILRNKLVSVLDDVEEVVIPSGLVTEIEEEAFMSKTSLTKVIIEDGVTAIGDWAFDSCHHLKEVVLPKTLTTLGKRVFYECLSLETVVIPKGVREIQAETFFYCCKLVHLSIPDTVTHIDIGAFHCCESLKEVHFPSSIKFIGNYAFSKCTGLRDVYISDKMLMEPFFDLCTFDKCPNARISVPARLDVIGTISAVVIRRGLSFHPLLHGVLNNDNNNNTQMEQRAAANYSTCIFMCVQRMTKSLPSELVELILSLSEHPFTIPEKITSALRTGKRYHPPQIQAYDAYVQKWAEWGNSNPSLTRAEIPDFSEIMISVTTLQLLVGVGWFPRCTFHYIYN
eukprot:m.156070 g.156070  ORF g.156070 m.156070 type:complete len:362 (+) comp15094_c1_seq3:144-1229(+)